MKAILVAALVALAVSILFTPYLIKVFSRQGFGQEIREDGPQHHKKKRGTPTMGGTAILIAMWCGYLGDERTIGYYRDAIGEHRPVEMIGWTVEEDAQHRAKLWRAAGVDGSYRASVPPVKVLEFVRAARLSDWAADAAFGIVVGMTEGAKHEALRAAARGVGGSVYFVEGGRTHVELDEATQALLQRLKAAFDPDQKLEPLPQP